MSPGLRRRLRWGLAIAALAGCSGEQPPVRPNLLLITIDTLRADHVGSYGYRRPTTPQIDALATRGVRFARCYSPASWTAPAMFSLITGVAPPQHGIVHGQVDAEPTAGAGSGAAPRVVLQEVLAEEWTTIAEALRDRGYTTAGFSSNGHLVRAQGFAQGFDHFDESCLWERADCVNARVLAWLAAQPPRQPFFLWVHYFDPHHDTTRPDRRYDPQPPYDTLFPGEGPPLGVERSLALYDGEIRRTDDAVGELLERIGRSANPASTTVVLTADHGDEFLERGNWYHTKTVYDELVRVPLIVAPGGGRGGRVIDTPVALTDLLPTLLDLAGAKPAFAAEGLSLAPLLAGKPGGEAFAQRGLYGETRRWAGLDRRYWLTGRHKVIVDREAGTREIYDIVADPGERRDLAPAEPALADRLQGALAGYLSRADRVRYPAQLRPEDDPARIEALRALGYLR